MSRVTTDHQQIRAWAEARDGKPVAVRALEGNDPGIIRLDFPGYGGGDELVEISWEQFFRRFEEGQLAFVYQETTVDGRQSNFNKLIRREPAAGQSAPS